MALLSEWLARTGTPISAVAQHCDVALSTVYRWRDGIKVPRPEQAAALSDFTGGEVTANDHQAAYIARQNLSLMGTAGASNGDASGRATCALPHTGDVA